MEFFYGTWHWSISGFLIGFVMLLLTYFGKNFGMSSNLRTMCSIAGAGKHSDFFNINWRDLKWNLIVVLGVIVGGFIAFYFLNNGTEVVLNPTTVLQLNAMGIDKTEGSFLPQVMFGLEALTSFKGIAILFLGGALVGFGARYAGGCTSGHAISGLSNLQMPSLIAVIGFFIGGLVSAHILLPLIFS